MQKGKNVRNRIGIVKNPAGRQFLRTVAVRSRRWRLPWPGVPP